MWLYYTASIKNQKRILKIFSKLQKNTTKNKSMSKWMIRLKYFYWNWLISHQNKTVSWILFQSFSSFELTSFFAKKKRPLEGHSRKILFLPLCPIFSPLLPHLLVPQPGRIYPAATPRPHLPGHLPFGLKAQNSCPLSKPSGSSLPLSCSRRAPGSYVFWGPLRACLGFSQSISSLCCFLSVSPLNMGFSRAMMIHNRGGPRWAVSALGFSKMQVSSFLWEPNWRCSTVHSPSFLMWRALYPSQRNLSWLPKGP